MDLVRLDRQLIRERVEAVFRGFPEIVGVYLFGSALDYCRPDSDVDLGVFVRPDLSERERYLLENELALRLQSFNGHPFDITVVDPRHSHFAFRVFSEGAPVYVGDTEQLTDLMERVSREHGEFAYWYQLAIREILEEARTHGP
ncbi:MAG: nucleotidyltransferase domain-containing protein [Bacillota bacterium]|nr:nucleotidyltransferase domain-containing protein [Bacillota bacterium]